MDKRKGSSVYLLKQSNGTVTVYNESRLYEEFEIASPDFQTTYRLKRVHNKRGVGWTYQYSPSDVGGYEFRNYNRPVSVTHTSGKTIVLKYQDGILKSVQDPNGKIYTYDIGYADGFDYGTDLRSVTFPDGNVTKYIYGVPGVILLVGTEINGIRYSTDTYRELVRGGFVALSNELSGGVEKYQFEYTYNTDSSGNTFITQVVETNPLLKKTTYVFDHGKLVSATGQPSANCAQTYTSTTYDAGGYKDIAKDANGNVTDFDYVDGRVVRKIEGKGSEDERTTEYKWDVVRNVIVEVKVLGQKQTNYVYNADDRIASVTERNLIDKRRF